jgi:hypothetical protein
MYGGEEKYIYRFREETRRNDTTVQELNVRNCFAE